jgi:hypothetical protein
MVRLDVFFVGTFLLLDHPSLVHSTNPKVIDGWFLSACEMYKCPLQICDLSHLLFVLQLEHSHLLFQLVWVWVWIYLVSVGEELKGA